MTRSTELGDLERRAANFQVRSLREAGKRRALQDQQSDGNPDSVADLVVMGAHLMLFARKNRDTSVSFRGMIMAQACSANP
jgi:hypothetical protein